MTDRTDDRHLIESRIESEQVFDGKLLHVRRDTVRLPDGGTATREYIVHPGAVLMVPALDAGRYVLERQFRYPNGRVFLEFPAGKVDVGESTLDTGKTRTRRRGRLHGARLDASRHRASGISYSNEFDRVVAGRRIDARRVTGWTRTSTWNWSR